MTLFIYQPRTVDLAPLVLIFAALLPLVNAEKYQSWFYWYNRPDEPTLSTLENTNCSSAFADYRTSIANGGLNGFGPLTYCYLVEDCMLSNLRASFIANYQAAAVILGITPTLLATLGPRIGEISLLSTTRPLLSFLISIGAPAVWPTRVFEYDDPSSALGKGVNRRVLPRQPKKRARIYSIIQYALVCGAIANILQVAIILGKQTVLSWSCEFDWGPLIWGLIPAFIHFLAAVSYHFEVRGAERKAFEELRNGEAMHHDSNSRIPYIDAAKQNPLSRRTTFIADREKMKWWQKEFTICANQPRGLATLLKDRQLPYFAVFFNCIASLCAFFHLFFGTMIFSSLTFIAVYDILNFIFWRYILSTVICRLVLLTELMGMREEEVKDIERVAEDVAILKGKMSKVEARSQSIQSPAVSPRFGHATSNNAEEFELKNRAPTSMERA